MGIGSQSTSGFFEAKAADLRGEVMNLRQPQIYGAADYVFVEMSICLMRLKSANRQHIESFSCRSPARGRCAIINAFQHILDFVSEFTRRSNTNANLVL
jgi:hypothetical protein